MLATVQEDAGCLPRYRCVSDAQTFSMSEDNRDLEGVWENQEPEMLSSTCHG